MKLATLGARLRASIVATAVGWAAAVAATLPMQIHEIASNPAGGWRAIAWSLSAGTLVWLVWTLAIAAGGWLGGALPVTLFVPEGWLLRHRRPAIAMSAAIGWVVVLIQFQVWYVYKPDYSINRWLLTLYSLLLTVFSGVTAAVYLRIRAYRSIIG